MDVVDGSQLHDVAPADEPVVEPVVETGVDAALEADLAAAEGGHEVTAVRPFVGRGRDLTLPPDAADAGSGVRAYAITGGRAHAAVHLAFETMLQATPAARESHASLRFERGDIIRLCGNEPLSVAELSARLHLPIGVVRVVAADLLTEDLVEAFHPSENVADDVLLLTRLIAGVRAL